MKRLEPNENFFNESMSEKVIPFEDRVEEFNKDFPTIPVTDKVKDLEDKTIILIELTDGK